MLHTEELSHAALLFFALLYDLFRLKAQRYYHSAANAVKRTIKRKTLP